MRALLFVCGFQLLARACSAQLPVQGRYLGWRCDVKVVGTTSDEVAEYMETLRPTQQFVIFTIPPVCGHHVGLRAVACDTSSEPPNLELRGRELVLERRDDATGFGELSVTLYCARTVAKPSFQDLSAADTSPVPSAASVFLPAIRSALSRVMPPEVPGMQALSPIVHQIAR